MLLRILLICIASLTSIGLGAAQAKGPAYTDPANADTDFAFQGEYAVKADNDTAANKLGAQVVALGEGKFDIVVYQGGLPGDGWDEKSKFTAQGALKDSAVEIRSEDRQSHHPKLVGTSIQDGKWKLEDVTLDKVHRKSPTLGAKPPKDGVVLFDGTSADNFKNGKLTEDGLLQQGCTSKQEFGSHTVHIEFLLPYQPKDRGQGRGNSGMYLQGRYEIQMLDSFGLKGEANECGALYTIAGPRINMCYPPLAWQTYDVDFTAAKYDADGKIASNPRITVRHNGVLIHENLELPANQETRAAPLKGAAPRGPIFLQDHGNPVRYRNIWVVEKE